MSPPQQASSSSGSFPTDSASHSPQNGSTALHQRGYNVGAMAAQALSSALANPYGQTHYPSYTNANYYSYFTQTQLPMTTAEGYTLSSTYVPNMGSLGLTPQPPGRGRARNAYPTHCPSRPFVNNSSAAHGGDKCTYSGCHFTGSKKTVEIHMMDRHLIFPPGWKKRPDDWDADLSLKGKPVPIPGTGVTLDTPEAIDAWIAERKKKWPSKTNVENKKRKAQEAADRGEITPSELILNNRKRRNLGDSLPEWEGRGRGRGKGRNIGRGRGRGHPWRADSGWRGRGRSATHPSAKRPSDDTGVRGSPERRTRAVSTSDSSSSESSDSDMDPVKDAVSSKMHDPDAASRNPDTNPDQEVRAENDPSTVPTVLDPSETPRQPLRGHLVAPQPKQPPRNTVPTKSSLLRNLLLPEIRHTVSNLSQTIHFLVENNFLEGVELKPGDADSQRIKVLSSGLPDTSGHAGTGGVD